MFSPQEEIEIVKSCLEGNRKSQEKLFRVYSPKMFGICLSYARNEDNAKDVLQDSFIKVFNNLNSFVEGNSLEKWIRRIIINTAIDHYRKGLKTVWLKAEYIDEAYPSVQQDVLAQIGEKELMEIIKSLPEGYKMVFNLYVVEGFSHKEIGEMLGVSEGTSKSQFFHAKRMLKEKIRQFYGETAYINSTEPFAIHGEEISKLVSA